MFLHRNRRRLACLVLTPALFATTLTLVSSRASVAQTTDTAARLHGQLETIVAGKDSAERGAAITRQLEKLEVKVRTQPFEKQNRRGTNIIVDLPSSNPAAKTLMIGAHYDRVAVGQGAVDNAASCVMQLELLPRLKKSPLKNFNLQIAFWDLEEGGLTGSQAYVDAARADDGDELKLPDAYINFDIFGYGDTLWVMSPKDDTPLSDAARTAGRDAKFPVRIGAKYPPSDHLSFIRGGVPTIAVSLIDGAEIDGVIQMISGAAAKGDKRPRIFEIIHSPNDTIDKVDANAVEKALPVVEQILRQFDKSVP
jgi:Zn-dependent M28 family amino/carboxypeptidase